MEEEEPKFSEENLIQLSILRGEEIDKLVEQNLLPQSSRFTDEVLNTLTFPHPEVVITLHTGQHYPAEQLTCEFENLSLPRLVMDELRIEIRKIVVQDTERNNYGCWKAREEDGEDVFGAFIFEMSAMHIARRAVELLNAYRKQRKSDDLEVGETKAVLSKYKNDSISQGGIDLSAIPADISASSILGKTLEKICALIPQYFRILHVESVLRNDLSNKFLKQQTFIREQLQGLNSQQLKKCIPKDHPHNLHNSSDRKELAEYLTLPHLTFHGTSNRFVPSIVRHGFLTPDTTNPETGEKHQVLCGSTYGRGIYSSPSALFALSYSGSEARPTSPNGFWGLKLIVCATIMGRSREMHREDNWRDQLQPYEGADSHVANSGQEYVVFSSAQILPVYVVHLDWGQDNALYFKDIPVDAKMWKPKVHPKLMAKVEAPGDKQRKKQALMAKAAKYFPYGFGPAMGTSFVVEDVGEVDDDEEEYGDYQKDRLENGDGGDGGDGEGKNIWDWDWDHMEEGSLLDEYKESRTSYRKAK